MGMDQKYVLNTFNLVGSMKALPFIWKITNEYKKHVITSWPFHTGVNYMGMETGHKCRSSGYSEILIDAELITRVCQDSVLREKTYAKALFCLKTLSKTNEQLLIERFVEEEKVDVTNPMSLLNLIQPCNHNKLDFALQNLSTFTILDKHLSNEDKVHAGHLGKTTTFWLSVIDHTRMILML